MAERIDEWPRVHTCLKNWCPAKNPECDTCDEVCRIMVQAQRDERARQQQREG